MVQFVENEHTLEVQQPKSLYLPRVIHIRANMSGLENPHIHFALLKYDPVPPYEQLLAQGESAERAWIAPFGQVRIDQIFSLYAWSSVPGASSRVARLSGLSLGIATPGDDNKRWLVTFPLLHHGEWVAWCIEIAMEGCDTLPDSEIVLSEENVRRLA